MTSASEGRSTIRSDDSFRYLLPIAGMFVATLLVANTTASKLFVIFGFTFPAGIIVFPISYIFGDVLTEVYGYARTRRVIWTGFAAITFAAVIYWITIEIPPAPFWKDQEAYSLVLGQVPRIILASILGYLVGEFVNSFVLAKMKILTEGRHLWSRLIGSTVVGQVVDTLIFVTVGFGGTVPLPVIVNIIVSIYLFKVLYEVIISPVTYVITGFLKRHEGIDTFDHGTDFSPLRW